MEIEFFDKAIADIEFWKKSGNKTVQTRITKLLDSICKTPYSGLGKPEPLKHKYKGYWSRRIDGEHRLIYRVKEDAILIAKCRFHYD